MKILYSLCSWGLGHATRSLPIIRRLLKDSHEVTVYATGRSLDLLRSELGDSCRFIESTPYPSPYSDKIGFAFRFVKTAPKILSLIKEETASVGKIVKDNKIDIIISDSRFGSYSKDIPSYLIFHQPRFIAPYRFFFGEMATEFYNKRLQGRFNKIIVPDYEERKYSLSGDLSHNLRYFKKENIEYIGILSDFEKLDLPQDIDYLFSISGPEPTRTALEKTLLSQLNRLTGNIVVVLGKPGAYTMETSGNATIYSFLEKKRRDEVMNRAKMVVSRSGYTTVLDLAEIGKKALFIPTPGQTEQVYLADHLERQGFFKSVKQRRLKIDADIDEALKYEGFAPPWKTEESLTKFLKVIGV